MIYNGVIGKDGEWHVYVKYQDGTEHRGPFPSLAEAKKEWKKGHLAWNHTKRSVKECQVYEIRPVVTHEVVLISK